MFWERTCRADHTKKVFVKAKLKDMAQQLSRPSLVLVNSSCGFSMVDRDTGYMTRYVEVTCMFRIGKMETTEDGILLPAMLDCATKHSPQHPRACVRHKQMDQARAFRNRPLSAYYCTASHTCYSLYLGVLLPLKSVRV